MNKDVRLRIAILVALVMASLVALDLHEGKRSLALRDFTLGGVFIVASLRARRTAQASPETAGQV